MEYNVLVLSAGRRVELIKCFKNAAQKLNIKSKIIAVDIEETAPALYFSDKYYIISRIDNDKFIDNIVNISEKEAINLIVPTIDTELLKLAKNKDNIEDKTKAKVLISDYNLIEKCNDKFKTMRFLSENNFFVPFTYSNEHLEDVKFPVFIKPYNGSSSIDTYKICNFKELAFFKDYIKSPIIQEFILGTEYSVDVFCDFDFNPITIVPRVRLSVRSGEILKGKIEKNEQIINEMKRLVNVIKPLGHITVQCILSDNKVYILEINPRFGGGAPMSIKAGANSCENLYRLLQGEHLSYNENYMDNLVFSRFDDCISINSGNDIR